MKRVLVSMGLLACLAASAAAQNAPTPAQPEISLGSFNPENPVAAANYVEGDGIKVGEGTSIYPVFGVATGAVSNVFYEANDPNRAGILRLSASLAAGSLSGPRLSANNAGIGGDQQDRGEFVYRAGLSLAYDLMLSGNETVTDQGGLSAGALFRGLVHPNGPVTFGFDDTFTRMIRAANFETNANTNRIINNLSLDLIFHSPSSNLSAYLYYMNTVDVFEEDSIDFANRIQHRFGIHPSYKLLPQTSLYADVSLGVYSGLGSDTQKVDSYPLSASAGIATLFTPRVTLNLHAGYTNGFYASGPSYSAFAAGTQIGYRYSEYGRIGATYDLSYEDSVNANYYRDHAFRVWIEQQVSALAFVVQPELHIRQYDGITAVMGPPTRNDLIVAVTAGVHYSFRNSIAATLDYRFSEVDTDYRYMTGSITDDPSFVRHEVLAGVRMAL